MAFLSSLESTCFVEICVHESHKLSSPANVSRKDTKQNTGIAHEQNHRGVKELARAFFVVGVSGKSCENGAILRLSTRFCTCSSCSKVANSLYSPTSVRRKLQTLVRELKVV